MTWVEAQLAAHKRLKAKGRIVPHVFHRDAYVKQADGTWTLQPGQPIKSFIKVWRAACRTAGYPGRIPHDLRRSAIRTFVPAGISEHTAMALSGHKTSSVFRRYDIVSDSDLEEAAAKLDEMHTGARSASVPAKYPTNKKK